MVALRAEVERRVQVPVRGTIDRRKPRLQLVAPLLETAAPRKDGLRKGQTSIASDPETALAVTYQNAKGANRSATGNALVRSFQPLVRSIATDVFFGSRNRHVKVEDLMQEGNIGLLNAAEKFDVRRGNKFSTFAYWKIKGAMLRAIDNTGRTIRLPVGAIEGLRKIAEYVQIHWQQHGELPSKEQVAKGAKISIATVRRLSDVPQMQDLQRKQRKRDKPGNPLEALEALEDVQSENPMEAMERSERRELVKRLLAELDPRSRKILIDRVVLEKQQKEIAQRLGITSSRVRQLKRSALERLAGRARALEGSIPEIVVPLDTRGRRNWSALSEEEMVQYTRRFIESNGIQRPEELKRMDKSLEFTLRKRGLLGRLRFERKRRSWKGVDDMTVIRAAQELVDRKKIRNRRALNELDGGLRKELNRRRLLRSIRFEKRRNEWARMSPSKLVAHTQQLVDQQNIQNRRGLEQANRSLYRALHRRKGRWMDRIVFFEQTRGASILRRAA